MLELLSSNKSKIINLNIGTGKGTSVLELIKTFEKTNKIKIPYKFTDRRDGDAAIVVAENRRLKLTLNWKPEKTIEEMCRDGWNWQRLNPTGYCV